MYFLFSLWWDMHKKPQLDKNHEAWTNIFWRCWCKVKSAPTSPGCFTRAVGEGKPSLFSARYRNVLTWRSPSDTENEMKITVLIMAEIRVDEREFKKIYWTVQCCVSAQWACFWACVMLKSNTLLRNWNSHFDKDPHVVQTVCVSLLIPFTLQISSPTQNQFTFTPLINVVSNLLQQRKARLHYLHYWHY